MMFFLPKCYKRLEQESSLLKNSGWCEQNLKKNWFISPDLQKKKRKKLFLNSFENLQFFSSLSLTSFQQPHLQPPNISCSWKHWLIKSIFLKFIQLLMRNWKQALVKKNFVKN